MSSKVQFSETESRILGYRFGRCNTESIDVAELKEEIFKGRFDIVRLRTSSYDEFATNKLEQLGIPYYFAGGVRRYRINCKQGQVPAFTHSDIGFELYTGQRKDLLEYLLKDTWGDYPLGYYKTPVLSDMFDKEIESKALFEFYAHFNNNSLFPNNYLWFMKKGEKHVGFVALYVYRDEDMLDSTIAGIEKPYQTQGLFSNIIRHVRQFCMDQKLTYFCCGARNENFHSQWAFEREEMRGFAVEYIYHLLPFLSVKANATEQINGIDLGELPYNFSGRLNSRLIVLNEHKTGGPLSAETAIAGGASHKLEITRYNAADELVAVRYNLSEGGV